jgi:bifunctional DNase/RNase
MLGRTLVTVVVLLVSFLTPVNRSANKPASAPEAVEVEVSRLMMVDESRSVLLLLKPASSDSGFGPKVLPLVIGLEEARSIGIAYHKMTAPRPLSHDLMKRIIEEYEGSVENCVITKMENETFFAELHLKRGGRDLTIDCRPSDAIALAMRSGAKLLVRRPVFEKHSVDPANPPASEKKFKA